MTNSSPQAGDHVAGADAVGQPGSGALQQRVAAGMAGGVVHALEAVQVEKEQRQFAALVARAFDGAFEVADEEAAVGQARERIVRGQVAQALFRALDVGNVGKRQHHAAGQRIPMPADRDDILAQPHQLTRFEQHAVDVAQHRLAAAQNLRRRHHGRLDVVAVFVHDALDRIEPVAADELPRTHAQDALRTGVGGQHHPVQRLDHHAFMQVRDGQPVALLAFGKAPLDAVFLNGDAGQVGDVVQEMLLFFHRQARLSIEQRQHAQLVAARRSNGQGPRRGKAGRQRRRALVLPARVGGDVVDEDRVAEVDGAAASAGLGADGVFSSVAA